MTPARLAALRLVAAGGAPGRRDTLAALVAARLVEVAVRYVEHRGGLRAEVGAVSLTAAGRVALDRAAPRLDSMGRACYSLGMTNTDTAARRALRIGYAAGSTDGGEWLTIWGSAYRSDLLYPTRAEAEARAAELRDGSVPAAHDRIIVARVERLGGLYNRILPDAAAAPVEAPAAAVGMLDLDADTVGMLF